MYVTNERDAFLYNTLLIFCADNVRIYDIILYRPLHMQMTKYWKHVLLVIGHDIF